jgi:hypothetical protein
LKTWKKCFYNIPDPKETLYASVCITNSLSDDYEVSSPECNAVSIIINKLKSNKAAGSDSIPPELIKNKRSSDIVEKNGRLSNLILPKWIYY